MHSVLIILLGCNIYSILKNRVDTSFNHIEQIHQKFFEQTKITWFLSGGIKNNHPGAKSEASIMKSQIDNNINLRFLSGNIGSNYIGSDKINTFTYSSGNNIKWDFVLDELSTNTAENFIRASDFLNRTSSSFDSVYIVTSDFHYKRASMMMNLIDPSRQYHWILGDKELSDSRSWEEVHIQNVHSDVSKAFEIVN
jgi:uncharacterized SAM-binding protein YcdF (DUF218 family)